MNRYNRFNVSKKQIISVGWIDETIYPELVKNKEIINELQYLIDKQKWQLFNSVKKLLPIY